MHRLIINDASYNLLGYYSLSVKVWSKSSSPMILRKVVFSDENNDNGEDKKVRPEKRGQK